MSLDNIKAMLFDVDGTLINRQCVMSASLQKTLRELKNKGYKLAVNSGRPAFSSLEVMKNNHCEDLFDYYFGSNGNELFDIKKNTSTFIASLTPETIAKLDKAFNQDFLSLAMYGDNFELLFNHYPKDEYYVKEWCRLRYVKPIEYNYQTNTKSFPKAIILFPFDTKDDVLEIVNNINIEEVDIFISGKDVMEIVPKGINKGSAVDLYSEILNIDKKDILSFGDAENDVKALLKATGCIVGNEELKNKYDIPYFCLNVNEDGVCEFLKRFL